MANLETLELTISGTSGEAKQGIDKLSRSLSYLSSEIAKSVSGLVKMNAELDKLKKAGAIKLPSISAATSRTARTASTITNTARTPLSITNGMGFQPGYQTEAERMAKNPQWYQNPEEQARQAQMRLRDSGSSATWAKETEQATKEYNKLAQAADKATPSVKNTTTAIKETAKAAQESQSKISGAAKLFEQIGRIAKTLLIRTALRSLLKSFTESWTAAYNYSKKMGGEFAQNVDKARGAISSITTSLVQTFAPVLSALMPVIQTITTGISYLCTLLQRLFGLLGMGSELFGVSAEEIDKYAEASSKGGKATKNLLASWDQLNIIQSKGSSGSGGGKSKSFFSEIVSEEMAGINMIVAESMLAIGLILACTGHVGIGVAMMAIGAGSIAKTLIEDWGKLPDNIQKTIARIMMIAGIGMLAVGLIVTMFNPAIGIGLMALGIMNMGAIMTASKTGDISTEVTKEILRIMVIASLGLLAVGLIIAMFNPVMGIGLMIAGAGMLFSARSYAGDDNAFVKMVEQALTEIGDFFSKIWQDIMNVWDQVDKWFYDNVFKPIEDFATETWAAISEWWDGTIVANITAAWEGIKSFFSDLWGNAEDGTGIAGWATNAWNAVSMWWDSTIAKPVEDAWNSITTFFGTLFGDADTDGSIAHFAKSATEGVSKAWSDIVSDIETAWEAMGTWFSDNVTIPIYNFFIDCINGIISGINWVIDQINSLGVTSIATIGLLEKKYTSEEITKAQGSLGQGAGHDYMNGTMYEEMMKKRWGMDADGAYGIPRGDIFIANEQGAELVGQINGKTSVANQDQIVEGISTGVKNAQADQNTLLREQNGLLRALLEKEWDIHPSAEWGKFNQRSSEMWDMATGR